MGTPAILNGSNDGAALSSLYTALVQPQNRAQERFVRAWELSGFLASDGFEWAFEQDYRADELAAMLADVGFQEGAAFIRRAYSMVPQALLAPGQEELLFAHLRSNFEPLKALLHELSRGRQPTIAGTGQLRSAESTGLRSRAGVNAPAAWRRARRQALDEGA